MSEHDLWINLLNPPDFEELGKAVYNKLMKTVPKDVGSYRTIVIGGS